MNIKFICPRCKQILVFKSYNYYCPKCNKEYPIHKGIIDFTDSHTQNELYKEINMQFSHSPIGSKIRFMNFGLAYMPEGPDPENVIRQKVNRNSIRLLEYIFSSLNLKNKVLLDIGCGRGGTLLYCSMKEPSSFRIGIDNCIEGLKVIPFHENELLLCADSSNIPLCNNSVDIIVCIESFHAFDKKNFR